MKLNSVHGGVKTHSSRSSSRRSELIALKQAEAESAKIKLKYTQQEAALLIQKAESEANLQVLSQQKAFEFDAAEVKVLQEHDVEGSDGSESHVAPDIKFKLQTLPVVKPDNLVQEFIKKSTNNPTVSDTNIRENLCKFLLKKDQALSRLTIFSDKTDFLSLEMFVLICKMMTIYNSCINTSIKNVDF
ncbi:hypothetical protein DPMN_077458 [Dreissena polymorpha]|uniref:Uncharacterized protein n=1 Tax=Dreissena polymorpha TaxID=45954 RepID=A0A9D3YLZ1_DREPO|nr:hypothetical protein DPMN_077458 [Dreissena polymorpha]